MDVRRLSAAAVAAALAGPALGSINLELVPVPGSVTICDTVRVGVWAHHDGQDPYFTISALSVIFSWDPATLEFVGVPVDDQGMLASAFIPVNDPWGINEATPPADGEAFFAGFAPPGSPLSAITPVLLTELEFKAIGLAAASEVQVVEAAGSKKLILETIVYDSLGNDATGASASGFVQVGSSAGGCGPEPETCRADLNDDGTVDVQDLVAMFLLWGSSDDNADITDDGTVNVQDLLALVLAWGSCPE
jgi:hypothetical protein